MDVVPADAVLIRQFPSQNIQDIIPHPDFTVDIEQSTFCISPTSGDVINQFFPLVPFQVIFSSLVFCCWKRVFAMTSAFSWQNSVNLRPASFCTSRSNLPVTPGIY